MRTSDLRFGVDRRRGVVVARPVGVLDATTYPAFRDTLMRYAGGLPDGLPEGLVVDVQRLRMPSESALTVFSLVSLRVADWPGVPVLLVARDECARASLAGQSTPVYVSVDAAVSAVTHTVGSPPRRSRASLELPPSPLSTRRARYFVRKTCERWHVADMVTDAMTVATAFVENTLIHTDSVALLRMQLRRGLLTVAVSDDDPRPAVMRERLVGGVPPSGLLLVSATARSWGCAPASTGGKTVWAALRAPGIIAATAPYGTVDD